MNNLDNIFEDDININTDGLEYINIDIDKIDDESIKDAKEVLDNISKFYYDQEFMDSHPIFKKRLDTELESLRMLIKMKKADEETHDVLIKAIGANSGNASLYRALTDIQKSILSIITKISETVNSLNNIMRSYQEELELKQINDESKPESDDNVDASTFRGSKEFIQSMLDENKDGE